MKKQKAKQRRAAYDSPWKTSVERLFPHLCAFFFSDIHAPIDGRCRTQRCMPFAAISVGGEVDGGEEGCEWYDQPMIFDLVACGSFPYILQAVNDLP